MLCHVLCHTRWNRGGVRATKKITNIKTFSPILSSLSSSFVLILPPHVSSCFSAYFQLSKQGNPHFDCHLAVPSQSWLNLQVNFVCLLSCFLSLVSSWPTKISKQRAALRGLQDSTDSTTCDYKRKKEWMTRTRNEWVGIFSSLPSHFIIHRKVTGNN